MFSLFGHHHLDELFVVDFAIAINISFANHFIDFLVRELLTKVGHDVTQLGSRDETISSLSKPEGFKDLPSRYPSSASHHYQELGNGATAIGINL
jgi:hypothetical protein